MKQSKKREQALRELKRLAAGRVNDAVKLAYLSQEELERVDGLDLTALSEFKRNSSGTVEIKLIDRVAVLEKLIALLDRETDGAEAFFQALEQSEGDSGEDGAEA